MKFILGKKIGMSQIWREEEMTPVTKIQVGPCFVTQVKTEDRDGYNAVQIGFGEKKEKNIRKPQKGHLKSFSTKPRYLREFRISAEETQKFKAGDRIDAGTFEVGEKIDVTGVSKGRGFQGVVRRYGFAGAPKTHGTKDQERMPGSAGAMGVGRIFPGQKMPGRMGGENVTTKNLEIVEVDTENNILLIKGGIAGPNKGFISVKGEGELQTVAAEEAGAETEKKEEDAATEQEENSEQQEGADQENGQESGSSEAGSQETEDQGEESPDTSSQEEQKTESEEESEK